MKDLSDSLAKLSMKISNLSAVEQNYIKRNVFISNIGASTRIENAVLTDAEIDWIDTTLIEDSKTTAFHNKKEFILDKLSKDKERSLDEVAGCRAMLQLIDNESQNLFPLPMKFRNFYTVSYLSQEYIGSIKNL